MRTLPSDRWIREEHKSEFPDHAEIYWAGPNVKSFGAFIEGSRRTKPDWDKVTVQA
jgi:hypothetical protein